jgi:hypothetical protein
MPGVVLGKRARDVADGAGKFDPRQLPSFDVAFLFLTSASLQI